VWSNDNKVIFTTVEGEGNVVDAMRRLLLLTSVSMKEMMNEWENLNEEVAKVGVEGVEYI